jgi:ABC-type branched-subunit amino acid transport system substrate-binding protein
MPVVTTSRARWPVPIWLRTFKGKKIAVVDDKSAYGKGLADEMAKAIQAKGVKPALRESITAGEKDYSGLVSKLKSAPVSKSWPMVVTTPKWR